MITVRDKIKLALENPDCISKEMYNVRLKYWDKLFTFLANHEEDYDLVVNVYNVKKIINENIPLEN